MTTPASPEQFLREFAVEFDKVTDSTFSQTERDNFIKGWAKLLELREQEARDDERKQIEREVWEAKHKEWADHVRLIADTPIEVVRDNGKYFVREMITDIQRGQPDLIRVVITTPNNTSNTLEEPENKQ